MLKKKELIKYISFKNKLDNLNSNLFLKRKKIKNPFEELVFNESLSLKREKKNNSFLLSYRSFLLALTIALLFVSVFQSSFLSKKSDPLLLSFFQALENIFSRQINKPYIVTVGEFSDFQTAKQRAINLLPKLRQIEIKKLPTGVYTFEMEKFTSKEKAYSLSKQFIQNGFESVHVRYLPAQ